MSALPLSQKRNRVRRISLDAMFIALYVLFGVFLTVKTPIVEISLASVPILLAAALFGYDAIIIAACGSFVEQLLTYGIVVTTPLWLLPAILQAAVAWLAFALVRRRPMWTMILVIILCEALLTVTNTAVLYLDGYIMGYSVKALHLIALPRALNGTARIFISSILLPLLLPPLRKIFAAKK